MAPNVRVPLFTEAPSTVVGATPQDTFAFQFPFWSVDDVIVLVGGVAQDPATYGVQGLFVQLDENGDEIEVEGGYGSGVVTLNTPVSNVTVTIDRMVVGARETVFSKSAPLPMPALNADLNKVTARQQDLERKINAVEVGGVDPVQLAAVVGEKVDEAFAPLDASKAGVAANLSDMEDKGVARRNLRIKTICPEDEGAAADGVTDDIGPWQIAMDKAWVDGLVFENHPKTSYLLKGADPIWRPGVRWIGGLAGAGVPSASNAGLAAIWSDLGRTILGANRTIRVRGAASSNGVFTCREGLNGQVEAHSAAVRNAAFAGTHYTIEGEDTLIENFLSLGAEYVWRNGGFNRARVRDGRFDAMHGFQSAISLDRGDWRNLHKYPYVTFGLGNQSSSADHANYRPGVAYRITGTNDWIILEGLFSYASAIGALIETHPNGTGPLTIQMDQCGFDGLAFPPSSEGEPESPWVVEDSCGIVVVGKADRIRIVGATVAAQDLAFDVQLDDPKASVVIALGDTHGCRCAVKTSAGLTRLVGSTLRGLDGAYGATIDQGVALETVGNGKIVVDELTTVEGFAVAQKGNDLPGAFIGAPMIKDGGAVEGIAIHQVTISGTTAQPSRDYTSQMLVGEPGANLGTLGQVGTGRVVAFYFFNTTNVLAGGNIYLEEDTAFAASDILLLMDVGSGWKPFDQAVAMPDPEEPEPEPPVNLTPPSISGTPKVGSALTASQGSWNPPGVTYAYQWKVDGVNVGTNSNTYTPASGDLGKTVTVTVTATNPDGSASATSATTAAVSAASGPITDYDTFVAAMTAKAYSGSKGWTDEIGDFSGHCVTTVTGAPSGVMRGSSWGARAFEYQSVIARIIQHGLPSSAEMTAQVAGGFLIYFEYVRAYDYDSGELGYDRNGYPSVARGASEGIRLSKIIYWDGTTAKEMAPMSESGPTTYNHS